LAVSWPKQSQGGIDGARRLGARGSTICRGPRASSPGAAGGDGPSPGFRFMDGGAAIVRGPLDNFAGVRVFQGDRSPAPFKPISRGAFSAGDKARLQTASFPQKTGGDAKPKRPSGKSRPAGVGTGGERETPHIRRGRADEKKT